MSGTNTETGVAAVDLAQVEAQGIEVVHVADAGDKSLDRVAELALSKGLPIRMRMAISLWDWQQYVAWKGQTWRIEVADKAAAEATKEALEGFFDLLAAKGPVVAAEMLKDLQAVSQEIDHQEPTE